MRVFLGLPVPDPLVGACVRAQSLIRGGRPVPVEYLHVTMVFCEDASDDALEMLHDDLSGRVLRGAEIALSGVRYFGDPPKIIAAEVAWTQANHELHADVHRAALRAGLKPDTKRFRPHVTLARGRPDGSRLLETPPVTDPAKVHALNLWSSRLTPEGSIYEVLASYPLSEV